MSCHIVTCQLSLCTLWHDFGKKKYFGNVCKLFRFIMLFRTQNSYCTVVAKSFLSTKFLPSFKNMSDHSFTVIFRFCWDCADARWESQSWATPKKSNQIYHTHAQQVKKSTKLTLFQKHEWFFHWSFRCAEIKAIHSYAQQGCWQPLILKIKSRHLLLSNFPHFFVPELAFEVVFNLLPGLKLFNQWQASKLGKKEAKFSMEIMWCPSNSDFPPLCYGRVI